MTRVKFFVVEERLCPVCGMKAVHDDLWRTHLGIKRYCCSQQCVDRFIAHPGLYCGNPKTGPSEKQQGRMEIKRHQIIFYKAMPTESIVAISEAVGSMMGVKMLNVHREAVYVTYDLMVVSLEDIEWMIEGVLGQLYSPMVDRIKRGWIHCIEECELENLAHPTKKTVADVH